MQDNDFNAIKKEVDELLGRPSRPCIEVIDDRSAEYFRAMTGQQRLKIADEMFAATRAMILHHLAREHPDWTPQQVQKEAARRISHGAV